MSWISRLANTLRTSRIDAALDEELSFHVEERTRALMRVGLDRPAADARARAELVALSRRREASRDIKLVPWLDGLLRDVRHSTRRLARSPGFSLTAVTTLALGIGGVTTIFALVNTIVIQPLPYPESDRLVAVRHAAPGLGLEEAGLSSGTYFHYRAHAKSLETLAVYTETVQNLEGPDAAVERVSLTYAGPELFAALRVQPALGRLFTPEDAKPGFMNMTWPVPVLLSHKFWLSRFRGDPSIVGRTITIGHPRLVVGVLPADFAFPRAATEVWMLFEPTETSANFARALDYQAIARLRPGVDADAAARELRQILPSIEGAYPDATRQRIADVQLTPIVTPLKAEVIGDIGQSLWLLFGGMAFLLLVACANAANLSLLRADQRRGELAIRTALGAGFSDIVRLLVSEAALVSAAGVILGVAIADAALRATVAFAPVPFPRLAEVRLDGWGLAFSAILGALAALLLGALPFLIELTRSEVAGALKAHRLSGARTRLSQHVRHAFVAVQVALALTLLAGAALMAQSFWRLMRVDGGFNGTSVLTVEVGMPYRKAGNQQQIFGGLLDRVRALPGAQSAAAVSALPLDGGAEAYPVAVAGRAPSAEDRPVETRFMMPGYFDVMEIPVVEGVGVGVQARVVEPNPVVVSGGLARRLFAGESAIGKQVERRQANGKPIEMYDAIAKESRPVPPFTIVGVVADVHERSLRADPPEILYIPILDPPVERAIVATDMSLVIRTRVAPLLLASPVRQTIREFDSTLSIGRIRTMDAIVGRSTAADSFMATVLLVAATVSVFLGVIGVYGVVAHAVRRRSREIGIRVALGARPRRLVGLLLRESFVSILIGAATGLGLALLATRALRSFLFAVSPTDPSTLIFVTVLLVAVALAAAFVPAHRAAGADPVTPLRGE